MTLMLMLIRRSLLLLVFAWTGCTGGVFVDAPIFPGWTCSTCWDDLSQGPGGPERRR